MAYTIDGSYKETFTQLPVQSVQSGQSVQSASLPTTIQDLLKATKASKQSGIHKMWSPIHQRVVSLYVHYDASTDQNWVLILRYNHRGGTNPNLRPIDSGDFPIPTTAVLDTYKDESDTEGWGHLTPSYLSKLSASRVAFYATTTEHSRVINFASSAQSVVSYVMTGKGKFRAGRCFCTEPSAFFNRPESAMIPKDATTFNENKDLTQSPFSIPNVANWSIKTDGYRWEVDNSLSPSADAQKRGFEHDTLHMVFIQ